MAQYANKSDTELSEQDRADLQAIQDMLDNIALDHMYMDLAGIPGSPNDQDNDDDNDDDDDGDGGSTDDDSEADEDEAIDQG